MRSIRATLIMVLLPALAGVLAVSGWTAYRSASASLRAQLDEALLARARSFGNFVREDPEKLEFDFLGELEEESLGVLLRVNAADGRELARSPGWAGWPALESLPAETWRARDVPGGRMVSLGVRAIYELPDEAPATGVEAPAGSEVTLEVISRSGATAAAERSVLRALALGGGVAMLGAAGAAFLAVRRGLRPLNELGAHLSARTPTDLDAPLPRTPAPRELAPVRGAIDGLLARVRETLERERRFSDAAAHELRTPIAELLATTDVASRYPDDARLRRAVGESRTIALEMRSLVGALLALARGERLASCEDAGAERVLALARAEGAALESALRSRGVTLSIGGDERAAWRAPPGGALAIVRNLVRNAGEYTPEGGAITIGVSSEVGGARLVIENGPVTLAREDLPRLFEAFWRADAARSDREHRGLGLSIVRSFAAGLGLACHAELAPGAMLRIVIAPIAGAAPA